MAYNHKTAGESQYPIQMHGKVVNLSEEQIGQLLKKKWKEDIAVQKLFEEFDVSIDQVDDLQITITDLQGRYAETDIHQMKLDPGLFDAGKFFVDHYFVTIHELVHFCSRFKENLGTFFDPEEVLATVSACASLLAKGEDFDEIWNKVFPVLSFHFHDPADAKRFFVNCMKKAKKMLM
jgi:hypothetical protein